MRIGLHGMRHRPWRGLSDEEMSEEILDARRALEAAAGAPIDAAACPFGSYDRRVLGRLRDAGFGRVYTSDGGRTSTGAWLQARNTLRTGTGGGEVERIASAANAPAARAKRVKTLIKRLR